MVNFNQYQTNLYLHFVLIFNDHGPIKFTWGVELVVWVKQIKKLQGLIRTFNILIWCRN